MPITADTILFANTQNVVFGSDLLDTVVLTIGPDVIVSAIEGGPALATGSNDNDLHILNYGAILGTSGGKGAGTGILVAPTSYGEILNQSGGAIAGGDHAIGVHSQGPFHILNFGSITAVTNGVTFFADSSFDFVDNRGLIYGDVYGIVDEGYGDGPIVNSGRIEGGFEGILIDISGSDYKTIINRGTIAGRDYYGDGSDIMGSVVAASGRVHLVNSGHLQGGVYFNESDHFSDLVVNSGRIAGEVELGGGNDVFNGKGGTSGKVDGGWGNDHLTGGSHADILVGGPGKDTLTGGGGKDHFVFDYVLSSANVDRITDFTHGVDKIDLSHDDFGALFDVGHQLHAGTLHIGAAAHDYNDYIIYNPANGWLIYDSNGNSPGHAIHFATLDAHLTLTRSDFLVVA